jgi:hypothetical protein
MKNKENTIRVLLALFMIVLMNTSCIREQQNNKPLIANLYIVDSNQFEKKELQNISGHSPLAVKLYLRIKNDSKETVFVPIKNYKDSMLCSKFTVYHKGNILYSVANHSIANCEIPSQGTMFINLTLHSYVLRNSGISDSTDIQNLINDIEIKYNTCKSDSAYSKYRIKDIVIEKDKNIQFAFRNPETINEQE